MKENFGKLYARLYRENFKELETLRNKSKITSVFAIILIIFAIILFMFAIMGTIEYFVSTWKGLFVLILGIGGLIARIRKNKRMFISTKGNPEYVEKFKEKVIAPIIQNSFENAKYEHKKGLPMEVFKKAGFYDQSQRYSSDDLITIELKSDETTSTLMSLADVHTEIISMGKDRKLRDITQFSAADKDRNLKYITQFRGIVGSFQLPQNINSSIYISNNGTVADNNKIKVKMDMLEFENIFDVTSADKVLAMRILTADVMAEMVDLYNKYKYRFEISIIKDTVYMRLETGAMFEPNVFKSSLEYKQLEKYYIVLKALINIATHICDTISKLDV